MGIKIYWTDFAKNELKNIFTYYKKEASLNVARKLVIEITKETLKLAEQPEIGQQEKLLLNDLKDFRYLIFKNYKIIYWINLKKNCIEILDVFDTRQNPVNIKRTK